jgi:hypothetical protein
VLHSMLRYRSVDDVLGPSENRFFGTGYKRVRHEITDVVVSGDGAGGGVTRACARLAYPGDWSRKEPQGGLRPHLSTVDALVIAVQLAEAHLTSSCEAGQDERRRMWLRAFTMRAGAAPVEELDGLAVSARAVDTFTATEPLCGQVTLFDCAIGTLRVCCEIAHEGMFTPREVVSFDRIDDILGPADERYFGDGFKAGALAIQDIEVDRGSGRTTALIRTLPESTCGPGDRGFGGAFRPSLSPLDCLVALSQLAQVLLYEVDGLRRDDSNTLWMRSVAISSPTPYQPAVLPFGAAVEIEKARRVATRGRIWRTATVQGCFQGFRATGSLAHQLPDGAASEHRIVDDRAVAAERTSR